MEHDAVRFCLEGGSPEGSNPVNMVSMFPSQLHELDERSFRELESQRWRDRRAGRERIVRDNSLKMIYRDDPEASLELLSPAGRRALEGNGHAVDRPRDDLRDEIDTLRKAVITMQRKRQPKTPKALTVQDGQVSYRRACQRDRRTVRSRRGVRETSSVEMDRHLARRLRG